MSRQTFNPDRDLLGARNARLHTFHKGDKPTSEAPDCRSTDNLSNIRVRRSGLVTFATRIGSTMTGLAFVLIVTRNLTPDQFGLWQLISKTLGYTVFLNIIISFWTTRQRARGYKVGKTTLYASLIFSAVAIPVYLVISYFIAESVVASSPPNSNWFFFVISAPQVLLATLITAPEALLWGYKPEIASLGFGIFELSKVALGALTVIILPIQPHLTGAIVALIGAELAQLISVLVFTRKEYSDRFSLSTMTTWFRTGWVAVLNNVYQLVINSDYLVVGFFTGSSISLAYFGAAATIAGIIVYGGLLASGLYASVLSGKNPSKTTSQVLELQLVLVLPMALGAIILSPYLVSILNPAYSVSANILKILAIGAAFGALSQTLDSLIAASDTTDAAQKADFSAYRRGRLFLLARINLIISAGYMISVVVLSAESVIRGANYIELGLLWALASLSASLIGFVVKLYYSKGIAELKIERSTTLALLAGTAAFSIIIYGLSALVIQPQGGAIVQTLIVLFEGSIALAIYAGVVLTFSESIRRSFKASIYTLLGR